MFAFACGLAVVQLSFQPGATEQLNEVRAQQQQQSSGYRATMPESLVEQGFFSALMTSGSFTMTQAGGWLAETLAPPTAACVAACAGCDVAAVTAACDAVVPQPAPHSAASELQDMVLAAACAKKHGCGGCLACREEQNGAAAAVRKADVNKT